MRFGCNHGTAARQSTPEALMVGRVQRKVGLPEARPVQCGAQGATWMENCASRSTRHSRSRFTLDYGAIRAGHGQLDRKCPAGCLCQPDAPGTRSYGRPGDGAWADLLVGSSVLLVGSMVWV